MSFRPILVPEFDDLRVSWAMCRNPMCKHFGVFYNDDNTNINGRNSGDKHYTLDTKTMRLKCKYCQQSTKMISNEAIRPIARYFLSQSLPFADCPVTHCENHGKNLFENFVPKISPAKRLYRKVDNSRAKCQACGKEFTFGHPLRASINKKTIKMLRDVITSNIKPESVTDAIESIDDSDDSDHIDAMSIGVYYRTLGWISARLQDHHAFRNAGLLQEKWSRKPIELLRVFTDTFAITLKDVHRSIDRRHKHLNVIASVVETAYKGNSSYYLLAAHPYFLPERFCPDQQTLRAERNLPESEKHWSCLERSFEGLEYDQSMGGYYIASPFAEVAHFMTIQKMLRRFQKTYHFMDADKSLLAASTVAYRERILADRSEFVLFQYQKGNATKSRRPQKLHVAWREAEKRFADKIKSKEDIFPESNPDSDARQRTCAYLFKQSFRGAFSGNGKWAWLEWPRDSNQYKNARTLWLTRRPHKTLESHGRQLLEKPSLQAIDSQFNSIRKRVASARRPKTRAEAGRSFIDNYYDPVVVANELSIYAFARNFRLRKKSSQKFTPGKAMQLISKKRYRLNLLSIVKEFRLTLTHADQMTRWSRSRQERQWPG